MSGASGNVPAAIHITPECVGGGPLGKVRDGDVIRLDSNAGVLEARVPQEEWQRRELPSVDLTRNQAGTGRELFKLFRAHAAGAEQGGGLLL
jgi:phosphogluconate dehydratase